MCRARMRLRPLPHLLSALRRGLPVTRLRVKPRPLSSSASIPVHSVVIARPQARAASSLLVLLFGNSGSGGGRTALDRSSGSLPPPHFATDDMAS